MTDSVHAVRFHGLTVGTGPRVVGILSNLERVSGFLAAPPHGCDVVELRVDHMDPLNATDWMQAVRAMEAAGWPVIVTLRLAAEGGQWQGPDEDRLPLFEEALTACACIDVELRSPLLPTLADAVRRTGKALIVSHHDFEKMPTAAALTDIARRAAVHEQTVVKIAAHVAHEAEVQTMANLLMHRPVPNPLCLIGMGDQGRCTRLDFPRQGSCLAYGHLDGSTAPGQYSCAELVAALAHP
jgi:3-dehydroquinate dehydratase I